MAKLQTKWIADDAVNEDKVKLGNDGFLRGRNAADSADVDIIKVDGSDNLVLGAKLNDPSSAAPTTDTQLANKKYVDDTVGAISLPSVFELQGNWDASGNSPTLANTDTGVDGYLYYVNVAGSVDFGAGSIAFAVGDWVYNVNGAWEKADNNDDVLSVAGKTGAVTLDTDDVSEGSNLYYTQARFDSAFGAKSTTDLSEGTNLYYTQARFDSAFTAKDTDALSEGATNLYYTEARFDSSLSGKDTGDVAEGSNLYFTEQRVQDSVLADYVVGADAALANTDTVVEAFGKLQGQVSAVAAATQDFQKDSFTLSAGDITNGSVTLSQTPVANSVRVFVVGSPEQEQGVDYTLSGVTLTFAGDLAAELVAGDKLIVNYAY